MKKSTLIVFLFLAISSTAQGVVVSSDTAKARSDADTIVIAQSGEAQIIRAVVIVLRAELAKVQAGQAPSTVAQIKAAIKTAIDSGGAD